MFKVIIFDVGGVIINFTEAQYVSYLAKRVKINKHRLMHVLAPLIVTMEYGRMDLDHAEKIFADHFNLPQSSLQWIETYRKFARPDENVMKLIKRLSKDYKIGIITNVAQSRYMECRKLALDRLNKYVSRAVVSSYVGLRKPNPKIYRLALRELHTKPKEALFIDNQIENVVAARKLGITSIWFKNYGQLMKELKKLDVL